MRELANVIERAVILTSGDTLVVDEAFIKRPTRAADHRPDEGLQAVERCHVIEILRKSDWKVKGPGNAADRLGLNPSTLRARMKKLGIERPASNRA